MVHFIKSRICALFISVMVLVIGIVGGTEAQVKMMQSVLDGLEYDDPDWITFGLDAR